MRSSSGDPWAELLLSPSVCDDAIPIVAAEAKLRRSHGHHDLEYSAGHIFPQERRTLNLARPSRAAREALAPSEPRRSSPRPSVDQIDARTYSPAKRREQRTGSYCRFVEGSCPATAEKIGPNRRRRGPDATSEPQEPSARLWLSFGPSSSGGILPFTIRRHRRSRHRMEPRQTPSRLAISR
jgi:hypothetical protein